MKIFALIEHGADLAHEIHGSNIARAGHRAMAERSGSRETFSWRINPFKKMGKKKKGFGDDESSSDDDRAVAGTKLRKETKYATI